MSREEACSHILFLQNDDDLDTKLGILQGADSVLPGYSGSCNRCHGNTSRDLLSSESSAAVDARESSFFLLLRLQR